MAKTFIIHDESLNTKGFWMLTSGADLSQFYKNPIMLWEHNRSWGDGREQNLPIGHWENIRVQGSVILAEAVFDSDEFSQTIAKKVEAGTLKMASAGAIPIERTDSPQYIKPGQRYETVTKWQLKEASIVNHGANHNALALSDVELYDNESNHIELSADGNSFLKAINQQPTIDENMNKVKKLLNLSETASEEDVLNAVNPLLTLSADLDKAKKEKTLLQEKLDAIELADKTAKATAAQTQIAAALLDGRLSDDAEKSTSTFWLSTFESNFALAEKNLKNLSKRKSVVELSGDEQKESAFIARQKEIDAKNKR